MRENGLGERWIQDLYSWKIAFLVVLQQGEETLVETTGDCLIRALRVNGVG